MPIDLPQTISQEMGLTAQQIARCIELLDDDNTVPFIARYRKEVTGGLDEVQLRDILERVTYLRNLESRKETVLRSIEDQGKLSDELKERIGSVTTLRQLEDLYLPYKPKRRTRATVAREKGLEPLALTMLAQDLDEGDLAELASSYLSEDVPSIDEAYAGACDIIAEDVAEDAEIRAGVRNSTRDTAWLTVSVNDEAADEKGVYQMYYDFREKMCDVPPHRLLAINRGKREGILKVKLDRPDEEIIRPIQAKVITNRRSIFTEQIGHAVVDSYQRLLGPSIQRELRGEFTESSDEHAIQNFSTNLRQLLLQPPLRNETVIGIDPGYRTGCKAAVVDNTGKFLEGVTIYPHQPQKQWAQAKTTIDQLIQKHGVGVIAIGNGTASRETESLAAEIVADPHNSTPESHELGYVMVSEAGASVYSASDVARTEFPDLDVSMRGAISIARRLQDPLAELVKIDPQSIGVGLYQHDVDQKKLGQALDDVVESAVNHVGVDVNTASASLLSYVSGVSPRVASATVKHRDENGRFDRRRDLKKVKGLGDKTFQQAVGFLKIPRGEEPLDNTFIHPESYLVVDRLFQHLGMLGDEKDLAAKIENVRKTADLAQMASQLEVGEPTLQDILEALAKPGRDPRDELPAPILRQDVLKMEDLEEGMILTGTVRNVVDFGAFVDIGVKQDGLVHVSKMANRYVTNPFELVSVGDVIKVKVVNVDTERGRIGLSMRDV